MRAHSLTYFNPCHKPPLASHIDAVTRPGVVSRTLMSLSKEAYAYRHPLSTHPHDGHRPRWLSFPQCVLVARAAADSDRRRSTSPVSEPNAPTLFYRGVVSLNP